MVLLIDANVLLNYLWNREPGYSEARAIITLCREEKISGYMAFHTISILWYALRKISKENRRSQLLDLCKVIKVTGAENEDVIDALLNENFADFEDCLQEKCAENIGADYIVTENIKDFKTSSIPAVTSAEMVGMLAK